ncbi:hypothetical protein D9M68_668520 [compost metagenome]
MLTSASPPASATPASRDDANRKITDCTTKNIEPVRQKPASAMAGLAKAAISRPTAIETNPTSSSSRPRCGVTASRGSAMAPTAAATQGSELSAPISSGESLP